MRRTLTTAPLAMLLLLAACTGSPGAVDETEAPAPTGGRSVAVEIAMFRFDPETIRVAPGEEIIWTNTDEILHTVTAGAPDDADREAFDANLEGPGTTFTLTLAEAGTYPYFCDRHPFMRGEIVVG